MRPSQILPRWFNLQHSERIVDETEVTKAKKLSSDPIQFFKQIVGFKPTKYQQELIASFLNSQFIAARWCRQSGKSWIISALLLWYALTHPDSNIAVVGPSWRQAKLIIRRIAYFTKKLPPGMAFKPLKTVIRFTNGSTIESFPNNPDTIRGPTLEVVYCDEMNFIANDEELYDAILFTLSTTNGKFVCSSTPWSTHSIFYKIFNDPAYSDFTKSHVKWEQALEPNGPLKKQILEKIKLQLEGDPWRWRREMEAEWAEDENVWLPQALITSCIDHQLEYCPFEKAPKGKFYAGLDLGKYKDHSVLAVVDVENTSIKLLHMHHFPLQTSYASVIGYVKTICDRWQTINKILVDMTGVGDYIAEDMINAGINQTEGVKFTQETKEKMAQWLKQCMTEKKLKIPYDSNLIAELNIERFELSKDGKMKLSHSEGTYDDRFWALALACYATKTESTPKFWVVSRMSKGKMKLQQLRKKLVKHNFAGVTR
jgi:phage FluMu gp28-like protein